LFNLKQGIPGIGGPQPALVSTVENAV